MAKPVIFIASSTEGLEVAEAIGENLNDFCEWRLWDKGVFEHGDFYLEALDKQVNSNDFAIMVLTNDDSCVSRGQEYNIPRDNVLLELGMFIGKLGRKRTFIVVDKTAKLKMPSDLSGLVTGSFEPPQNLRWINALSAVCIGIKSSIKRQGLLNPYRALLNQIKIVFRKK
jgi:predicted nucleotide-binding protein